MTNITESEFVRIVDGIIEDRESIIKHNPMGADDEVLLWMLLSCLVSYLNLADVETPCFSGRPNAKTYREAILFILKERLEPEFDPEPHLARLIY